ncbi:MAG TPA: hypothetical protein VMO76_08825 [Candidatus Udaeobacter sp.]|nr:hypothetical protein [Candidatus Udaeobacter sp.]
MLTPYGHPGRKGIWPAYTPDSVTDEMNKAGAELGAAKDEFASSAARRVLEQSPW